MRFFFMLATVICGATYAMDHSAARECAKNAAYFAVLLERKPVKAQDLLTRVEAVNASHILPCYQARCTGALQPWCAYNYYSTKRRVQKLSDDAIVALSGGAVNWAMKECEKADE